MKRSQIIFAACAAAIAIGGCAGFTPPHQHIHENWYRRGKVPDKALQITSTWCEGLRCHWAMHFDSHCQPVDDDGNSLTTINAKIGTHICFYNDSGCPLVLKFGNVLFGPTHPNITIDNGKCATLIVTREAAGQTFSIEQICTCVQGRGHTNPTVKVGDDEEG